MEKYKIWYENPQELDEELLEVCRKVAFGNDSYRLILENPYLEIPMANEIYKLMKKEYKDIGMPESEACFKADVKNISMNTYIDNMISALRSGLWGDDCEVNYRNLKCLIVRDVEKVTEKYMAETKFASMLEYRIKNGKKTVLLQTQKYQGSIVLQEVYKHLKTVHIEYARCEENITG